MPSRALVVDGNILVRAVRGKRVRENQLSQLREFVSRVGWTIVAEYIDHESGKISDREQAHFRGDAIYETR